MRCLVVVLDVEVLDVVVVDVVLDVDIVVDGVDVVDLSLIHI